MPLTNDAAYRRSGAARPGNNTTAMWDAFWSAVYRAHGVQVA